MDNFTGCKIARDCWLLPYRKKLIILDSFRVISIYLKFFFKKKIYSENNKSVKKYFLTVEEFLIEKLYIHFRG